jgi:hypothetical protein
LAERPEAISFLLISLSEFGAAHLLFVFQGHFHRLLRYAAEPHRLCLDRSNAPCSFGIDGLWDRSILLSGQCMEQQARQLAINPREQLSIARLRSKTMPSRFDAAFKMPLDFSHPKLAVKEN